MTKSYEELATEMTVAWLSAVSNAVASGRFNDSWLQVDSIEQVYKKSYDSIIKAINE